METQNQKWFQYLKSQDFVPSKKMGQNFLLNPNTQKAIIAKANINNNDNVLEIGPGMGAITQHLLNLTSNFLAVELDKRLYAYLKQEYKTLEIINDDILKVDLNNVFKDKKWTNVKVVANLPYSISSLIIINLLKNDYVGEINILVQKEMAQRISAKKQTKDYNAFTVLVSLYSDVEVLLNVSRKDFYPEPNVDSLFIKICKNKKPQVDFQAIDKFLKLAFIARRKKLTNNLSQKYDKQLIIDQLVSLGFNENTRPEELSPQDFLKLFNNLNKEI